MYSNQKDEGGQYKPWLKARTHRSINTQSRDHTFARAYSLDVAVSKATNWEIKKIPRLDTYVKNFYLLMQW